MSIREAALIRDLADPRHLPETSSSVRCVATHGSLVFIADRFVYKVKRARDYGFFDFSTAERRKRFCEEEVRLNRRTAPDVYLGVVPVTRDADGYSLNRPGEIVDTAVVMRRLPDDRSALHRLRAGQLTTADLAAIAGFIARFYRSAPEAASLPRALETNIEENFRQSRRFAGRYVAPEVLVETESLQRTWLARWRDALERRPSRDGHGDLRLEHVYLMPEGPIAIDCIEFLDRFRVADPALDVAFLAMDLHRHRRPDLAEWFLGRFAAESDDYGYYPLADGYMSYRAFVRGKVAGFVADDPGTPPAVVGRKAEEAKEYFDLSLRLIRPRAASGRGVIAVGGLIGSGKSTVAGALSARLGAPAISSDATRKFLAGIPHEARGDERIYTSAFTGRVEDEICRRAQDVLASNRPVILDMTFRSRATRARARGLARDAGAPFLLVECRAPEAVLRERLRRRTGGVSDAREDLLDRFLRGFEAVTELGPDEHVVVDTTEATEETIVRIAKRWESRFGNRSGASGCDGSVSESP